MYTTDTYNRDERTCIINREQLQGSGKLKHFDKRIRTCYLLVSKYPSKFLFSFSLVESLLASSSSNSNESINPNEFEESMGKWNEVPRCGRVTRCRARVHRSARYSRNFSRRKWSSSIQLGHSCRRTLYVTFRTTERTFQSITRHVHVLCPVIDFLL